MRVTISSLLGWALCLLFTRPAVVSADPVAVRFPEGLAHGLLVLRSLDGKVLAHGNLNQTASGGRVSSQVVFRFSDGSLHDETAVFSQNDVFRLLSYHLVQRGPSFHWQLDMTMNTESGLVVVRHTEKDGKEEVDEDTLELPLDVANGIVPILLKNLGPNTKSATSSFVAAIPSPRPVKLAISNIGSESISIAQDTHRATHYIVKAEIGGLAGLLAPLVGKQPPDTHVWILEGPVPAFIKSEGPLFYGGPIWRIELASTSASSTR
jgi:hypothetical protein